jgi:ProP effector
MESVVRVVIVPQLPFGRQASGEIAERTREGRPNIAPRRQAARTEAAVTIPSEQPKANRKTKIERNIAELVQAFPLVFSVHPERIKPLEIGIKRRIYARCTLSHREVGGALRGYTSRLAYLLSIIEGAVRVDLDGKATGYVTVREADYAAEQTKKIFAIAARKLKEKIRPNAPSGGRRSIASNAVGVEV